ncbi:hypothetical protein M0805_009462 [Coniferiporia weirii]|nr:hypothetical protein M0805_009462 [Coniferiporia weirii]
MSSSLSYSSSSSSSTPAASSSSSSSPPENAPPKQQQRQPWVDPAALPRATRDTLTYHSAAQIAGSAPLRAKQLALNTFATYGVGGADAFGHAAGRQVRFVRIDLEGGDAVEGVKETRGALGSGGSAGAGRALSVTSVAEVVVDKSMVNGNGMMHGGCIAYLIDNCGSVPLVVLGEVRGRNGVGVTQALNILYHGPASLGTTLEIVSTSLVLGGRSMTARCEIFDKSCKRLVASAFINKMEPKL